MQYARCGWAQDLSLPVADRAMLHADNAYHLPHARIESHRLRTNTASATAFRGFGGPQGMLGIERVMDHVAHTLGRDPLEVAYDVMLERDGRGLIYLPLIGYANGDLEAIRSMMMHPKAVFGLSDGGAYSVLI